MANGNNVSTFLIGFQWQLKFPYLHFFYVSVFYILKFNFVCAQYKVIYCIVLRFACLILNVMNENSFESV